MCAALFPSASAAMLQISDRSAKADRWPIDQAQRDDPQRSLRSPSAPGPSASEQTPPQRQRLSVACLGRALLGSGVVAAFLPNPARIAVARELPDLPFFAYPARAHRREDHGNK